MYRGNFQFYFRAFHLLDPDPHLSMRIRIQEASDYTDPCGSGSKTLQLKDVLKNTESCRVIGQLVLFMQAHAVYSSEFLPNQIIDVTPCTAISLNPVMSLATSFDRFG